LRKVQFTKVVSHKTVIKKLDTISGLECAHTPVEIARAEEIKIGKGKSGGRKIG
jgi:hypothetical protein